MRLRKPAAIMLILCLTVTLLSGCRKDQNHGLDPNAPTSIVIWHYYNGVQQENFDNMLRGFNETVGREMGIVVDARNKNSISDLADGVLAALRGDAGAEEAPDMFTAYAETVYVADQLGSVVDLSKYFTEAELSEYVSGYLEEGDLGSGGLKIFPTAKSTEILMLNDTDWKPFAEAEGLTYDDLSTWEGLAAVAEKYYGYTDALTPDVENDGKAFFGRDSVANYMIVSARQLGLEYTGTKDGETVVTLDKDVVRKLWDGYYAPYVKGYYYANARFRSDDAKVGDIIAMVCSTTGAAYFPSSVTINDQRSYGIEGVVLPVPNFEGTDPFAVQQGAGMAVVKSDEKKEYACSVFLRWFTEKERSIGFSAISGYLPVKKEANDFDAIAASFLAAGKSTDDPLLKAMEVAVQESVGYQFYAAKPFERSTEVRDFLDKHIQTTAQAAHDEAAERIGAGESREAVLAEYTSDEAFEAWYEEFCAGLRSVAGV